MCAYRGLTISLIFAQEAVLFVIGATCACSEFSLRYLFEDYALDADCRELLRGTQRVSVEPQVFDLLCYLIRNRNRVVSKDDLLAAVWDGRVVSESALSTRVNAARLALGDNGQEQRLIRTFPRKGLRFVGIVREEQGGDESPTSPLRWSRLSEQIFRADKWSACRG